MTKSSVVIIAATVLIFISCATTNYSKYYNEWNNITNMTDYVPLESDKKPLIEKFVDVEKQYWNVLADNYICLGNSNFEGVNIGEGDLQLVARKIGATYVIYSVGFTKTVNQAAVTTISSDGRTATTTQTGTNKYYHNAYYFVKSTRKLLIGLMYADLNDDIRDSAKRNTGVIVNVVYKESPAFFSNIIRGDIIIRANGDVINNSNDFKKIIENVKSGDMLNLVLWRNEREVLVTLKI